MPTQENKGRKFTKSSKKGDSASHPSTSFTYTSAGEQVDASYDAQIPTESPTTGHYLQQDSVETVDSAVISHEQNPNRQANDYATIEHKADTSQLEVWTYEVDNDNLTLAERLEKATWEQERLARL